MFHQSRSQMTRHPPQTRCTIPAPPFQSSLSTYRKMMPDTQNQSFQVSIPRPNEEPLNFAIESGTPLFVLGPNGTGKSALLHNFYTQHSSQALRILGHRQIWFETGIIDLTPRQKAQQLTSIRSQDTNHQSRWVNYNASQRPGITLANLQDAQRDAAQEIATAAYAKDIEAVQRLADEEPPIATLNRLLRIAQLPIHLSLGSDGDILAESPAGSTYDVAQMSDGERNALLIATEVLTAPPSSLLLIDEPELHLHRSIITPLLSSLFLERDDCAFAISTHEIGFSADFPNARVLVLQRCHFGRNSVGSWELNEVAAGALEDQLRSDVLGSRSTLLFVEGTHSSLDKRLYSLAFPGTTVKPKEGRGQVERFTSAVRDMTDLGMTKAYGIVDRDNRSDDEVEQLKANGIFALELCTVESIYYHPDVQRMVVDRHMELIGEDPESKLQEARSAAIDAVRRGIDHLVELRSARAVIQTYSEKTPGHKRLREISEVTLTIDVDEERRRQRQELETAVRQDELETLLRKYPIHQTGALEHIARRLGFQNRRQYEQAVLTMVMKEESALLLVRSFFGDLASELLEGSV